MATYVPTIAVDFDGTLCEHAFPGIGAMREGAKEALIAFKKLGYYIVIWSCRTSGWNEGIFGEKEAGAPIERKRVQEMIAWLDAHEIPYDEVDDGSRGKPLADYYIDDKAVPAQTLDWGTISRFIAWETLKRING